MRAHRKAGLLYILPALAVLAVWYLLLFEGSAPGVTPKGTFAHVLGEGPRPLWFRWLFLLPFLSLALGAAYASRIAATRVGAATLLGIGAVLAVVSWLTVSLEVALVTTLPLAYGLIAAHEAFAASPPAG